MSFTFGLTKPANVDNLFPPWLRSFSNKQKNLVRIGVTAFYWALWISKNELGAFWIRSWSILSKEEGRITLKEGCRLLETTTLEIINKSGWNALKRIKS
jgi:hypothetical protein